MEDKSFTNLLTEENLAKINIDPRLVDSFKRITDRLQTYFNANGYTSQRDYKKFFEEYLLKDMDSKLRIIVSNEPSKMGVSGFYRHDHGVQEIHIDETYLNNEEILDSIFCHEFIHFLVMRQLDAVEYSDPEIKNGGFINEALTEMLNQQIYPNSNSYQPQVDMLKFANLLTGNVNNYSYFLRGKVDCKGGASTWNNFFSSANAYQQSRRGKEFAMNQAINDPNYIDAQRHIISANISPHLISSFNDYKKWVSILQQRPAKDNEYTEQFMKTMDNFLISNLGIKNQQLSNIFLKKLEDYRSLSSEIKKDLYQFEIAGHKVGIDKDHNLYGTEDFRRTSTSWNPRTGVFELTVGNETITLNMNDIDFQKRQKDRQKIEQCFSKDIKANITALTKVAPKEGLIKLEKFTLPVIGKNKEDTIYVATYNTGIEILDNNHQKGKMTNVKDYQYLGVTSQDPQVGAIYSKPLDTIDKGIVFSKIGLKEKQAALKLIQDQLNSNISQDRLSKLLDQYKIHDDTLTAKELEDLALRKYAENQYNKMPATLKESLHDIVTKQANNYLISSKDGKIDISLLMGNPPKMAFKATKEVLVDTKGNGLYNEEFKVLKDQTILKESPQPTIKTTEKGDIVFPVSKEEKQVINRPANNKREAEINKELNPFPLPFSKVVITSKPKDYVKPPSKEEEKIKMTEKLNREREYERQKQAARKAEEAKRQERLKQEQEKQQKQNIAIEQENKLKQEKEKLEAERRELRRKQFLERERKMNLNRKNTLSFDDLINKSQELEQENIQEMEQEEDLGMQM